MLVVTGPRLMLLKHASHVEVEFTFFCSTMPLGFLQNQHLEPALPIACIPFPFSIKIKMLVKNGF